MHETYMHRALHLAEKGRLTCSPNPMVGCVIVRDDKIIAEGWHIKTGEPHAEVNAINMATDSVQNATAYITLEPCCHIGKTPPCTDLLIRSGIKYVYIACLDPNPLVAGKGVYCLKKAGIKVHVGTCEAEAKALNQHFFHYITQNKPYVIAKWAMSIDGKIASRTGDSQWISNATSRQQVHQLRQKVDAILVGANTARNDNPRLTVRLQSENSHPEVQPLRIILDGKRGLQNNLSLFSNSLPAKTVLASELMQTSNFTLDELLVQLGKQGIKTLLVEGGSATLTAFFSANLIDEVHCYIAPILIGGITAPTPFMGNGVETIQQAEKFCLISTAQHGEDVQCVYRKEA